MGPNISFSGWVSFANHQYVLKKHREIKEAKNKTCNSSLVIATCIDLADIATTEKNHLVTDYSYHRVLFLAHL